MSPLLIVWSVSLLVLVLEGVFAIFRPNSNRQGDSTTSFREFIAEELSILLRAGYQLIREVLPHGRKAFYVVSVRGRRASDVFVKRIFGRTEIERGKSSSFFLKHLAEHQEMDRRAGGDRQEL